MLIEGELILLFFLWSIYKSMSTKGRKKKPRCTDFDPQQLLCATRGPLGDQVSDGDVIILTLDELQTLVDKDRDKKTMEQGCRCMGVSKTVYAGIYASAREKLTQALITGSTLQICCQKQ